MTRIARALLLALSLTTAFAAAPASAAISETAIQCARDVTASGTSVTVSGADGWSTPSSGSLLVAVFAVSQAGNALVMTEPSGFTLAQEEEKGGGFFAGTGNVSYKESNGTETTFTASTTNSMPDLTLVVCEFPGTDLDPSTLEASNEDTSNVTTVDTSQPSGSASNTTADALVITAFMVKQVVGYQTGIAYTNSFVEQYTDEASASGDAGVFIASKVLSSAASQSSTLSTTDSGTESYGVILIFPGDVTKITTCTDDTVDVGTDATCSLNTAYTGSITKCTMGSGDEITATMADTDSANCPSAKDDFLSGGDLANTRIAVATTLALENATETSTADVFTFNSPDNGVNEHFGSLACVPGACPDDDSLFECTTAVCGADFPSGYTTGDDIWLSVDVGSCDFDPTYGAMTCDEAEASGTFKLYDVSTTDWSAEHTWSWSPPSVGGRHVLKRGLKIGIKRGLTQ